ncbi:MAG: hypothetical protein ACREP9_20115 [Candidatus Dormibacteraceae bacterium]
MNEQYLPLGPVDRRQAYRRHHLRKLGSGGGRGALAIAIVGLLLAGVGVWLNLLPNQYEVSQSASAYFIGGVRLAAQSDGSYAGPGGVLLLHSDRTGIEAAASTAIHGQSSRGRCWWASGASFEECSFQLGNRRLKALDRRVSYGWWRQYDDGEEVEFTIREHRVVLVPFAVGLR